MAKTIRHQWNEVYLPDGRRAIDNVQPSPGFRPIPLEEANANAGGVYLDPAGKSLYPSQLRPSGAGTPPPEEGLTAGNQAPGITAAPAPVNLPERALKLSKTVQDGIQEYYRNTPAADRLSPDQLFETSSAKAKAPKGAFPELAPKGSGAVREPLDGVAAGSQVERWRIPNGDGTYRSVYFKPFGGKNGSAPQRKPPLVLSISGWGWRGALESKSLKSTGS